MTTNDTLMIQVREVPEELRGQSEVRDALNPK
jgi:hypothetical protein